MRRWFESSRSGWMPAMVLAALACCGTARAQAPPMFEAPFYSIPIVANDCLITDVNGDGMADIVAVRDSVVAVHLNRGLRRFEMVSESPIPPGTHQLLQARIDSDSRPDLVLSGSYGVMTMIHQADDTFVPGVALTTADATAACGDFDGNDVTDVVVHEFDLCRVFVGRGDGTFAATAEMRPGEGRSVIADFDLDGRADVAAVAGDWQEKKVVLYLGDGAGGFSLPTTSWMWMEGTVTDIVAGDFTPDSLPDLAIRAADYIAWHAVLGNLGDGGFVHGCGECEASAAAPVPSPRGAASSEGMGTGPRLDHRPMGTTCIESADVNRDGRKDLLSTFVYTRSNTFTRVGFAGLGFAMMDQSAWERIRAGDLDGDGLVDVVGIGGRNLTVHPGRTPTTFGGGMQTEFDNHVEDGILADFNADGRLDAALGDGSAQIWLGNESGQFIPTDNLLEGRNSMAVADFNGDGHLDVIHGNGRAWLGDGTGAFTAAIGIPELDGHWHSRVIACDLNGDLLSDLVVSNEGGVGTRSFLGNGDGSFRPAADLPEASPICMVIDLNTDGRPDLVLGRWVAGGNGDGTFAALEEVSGTPLVGMADLSGDGIPDLLTTDGLILRGLGGGRFEPWLRAPIRAGNPEQVAFADFDGNGTMDIAVADDELVHVVLNNRAEGFVPAGNYGAWATIASVRAADVDRDGRSDLVVLSIGDHHGMHGTITTLMNKAPINHPPDVTLATPRVAGVLGGDGLVAIAIDGIVDADGDAVTTEVLSITQDEPILADGVDSTCPDAFVDGGTARVRLESWSMGNGRTYAIQYVARDPRGGHTESVAYLCVPAGDSAAGAAAECSDDGHAYDSRSCPIAGVSPQGGLPVALEYGIARASSRGVDFAVGMPGRAEGKLGIFDISGRRVAEFDLACEGPCRRTVTWQTSGTAPGVYFTRLQSPFGTRTRTVVLHR